MKVLSDPFLRYACNVSLGLLAGCLILGKRGIRSVGYVILFSALIMRPLTPSLGNEGLAFSWPEEFRSRSLEEARDMVLEIFVISA
jgi:hypothetical protein